MGKSQRTKGKAFERLVANAFSKTGGDWKRIPGSGAIGTNLKMSNLTGDVVGRYPWWSKGFKGECKVGYGTSKQMTFKRLWITKNREEAELDHKWPCIILKFNNVTSGDLESAKVIGFNWDTWGEMMQEIEELYAENLHLREQLYYQQEIVKDE